MVKIKSAKRKIAKLRAAKYKDVVFGLISGSTL